MYGNNSSHTDSFLRLIHAESFIIHIKNHTIMSANKSNKSRIYFSLALVIVGCILACSSIIPNDYLKLVIVMVSLGAGLYGIMRGLSTPPTEDEIAAEKK